MNQMMQSTAIKRTTVSFEDSDYALLEQWARKDVRSVPNLVTAIVVTVLRGETLALPDEVKQQVEQLMSVAK